MKEQEFAEELRVALSGALMQDVAVAITPWQGGEYVIRVEVGTAYASHIKDVDVPKDIRRTVIWTFEKGGRVAWIKIPNLNFMYLAADLMAGNLFGQGLTEEMRRGK